MKILIVGCALMFLSACSGSGEGAGAKYDRYVLTEEQISRTPATDTYEAILKWWPGFVPRGVVSSGRLPTVYVNGLRYGEVDALRRLPVEWVREVRYLNPTDANLELGVGNTGGAIMITTKE